MVVEEDQYEAEDDDAAWGEYDGAPRRNLRTRKVRDPGLRRSTRQSGNGRQSIPDDDSQEWRGERRSLRLGASAEMDLSEGPPRKRSRTVESSEAGTSSLAADSIATNGASGSNGAGLYQASGAAALKSTEVAVDSVMGKKKNKFWFYAVEPVGGSSGGMVTPSTTEADPPDEGPAERKSKARRVVDSAELSESGPELRDGLSATPENSAPMSLDSEAMGD